VLCIYAKTQKLSSHTTEEHHELEQQKQYV